MLPLPLAPRSRVLVSSTSSDAHTWNLVFLHLLMLEHGHEVHNLGPCVPVHVLVRDCLRLQPDLIVLSSVNGHGRLDGATAIRAIRGTPGLESVPAVIGGELTTTGSLSAAERAALLDAGFAAVLTGPRALDGLRRMLAPSALVAA